MKILTKEEERAHYRATIRGGIGGGVVGFAGGLGVVALAHRRFPAFHSLPLPLKAFLVTSAGSFGAIVSADKASRSFEKNRNEANQYQDVASRDAKAARQSEDTFSRLKTWGRENRYGIITASWIASMGIALGLVGRNPYLTRPQKLVQARVYAQALTVGVFVATAALEVGDANQGKGRWETVQIIDPNDPEHKHVIDKQIHHERYAGEDLWRDIVDSEERKMEERAKAVHEEEEQHHAKEHKGKRNDHEHEHDDGKDKAAAAQHSKDHNSDKSKDHESSKQNSTKKDGSK